MSLRNRKELFSKHLDDAYDYRMRLFLEDIKDYNGTYMIATDDWKRKACERGVHALVNCLIIFANGASKMWTVRSAAGYMSSAEYRRDECNIVHAEIQAAMGPAANVHTLYSVEKRPRLWQSLLDEEYAALSTVAVILLSMHTTTCAAERTCSPGSPGRNGG